MTIGMMWIRRLLTLIIQLAGSVSRLAHRGCWEAAMPTSNESSFIPAILTQRETVKTGGRLPLSRLWSAVCYHTFIL